MSDSDFIIDLLHSGVAYGEELGASFMEVRYDDLILTAINNTNSQMKDVSTKQRKGVGVMAYYEGTEGSSFTPELTLDGIKDAVKNAFKLAKSTAARNTLKLPFQRGSNTSVNLPEIGKIHPKDVEFEEKVALLDRVTSAMNNAAELKSTTALYGELYGDKIFVNSENTEIIWHPITVDLIGLAISMDEKGIPAKGSERKSGCLGLEIFDEKKGTPEYLGEIAGKRCIEQLTAKPFKSGKYRALIGPKIGGVLAHESFGHLSESDSVITGVSPLSGKVGDVLGTEYATIKDTGTLETPGAFYYPYDDQGIRTTDTMLLEKGILKGYLHNRGTAASMDVPTTGNSRAIHFMFPPIPRMKNTYFTPGDLSKEEALELLGTGVYAINTNGGQVGNDGNFLFQCSLGYYVENGEIQYPIRDTSLSGNILDFLKQIEQTSNTFEMYTGYYGGCGKAGQSPLPVGLGGPELLIKEVLIGGTK